MNADRLNECLDVIGWGMNALARQAGVRPDTARNWMSGRDPVPAWAAAWIEDLVAYHLAHPMPGPHADADAIDAALDTIGWSANELVFSIPPVVVAWLEDLAAYHEAHPRPAPPVGRNEAVR